MLCNEESLWCLWRALTNPNEEQRKCFPEPELPPLKKLYDAKVRKRQTRSRRKELKHPERRTYWKDYYARNKAKKNAAANERNKRLREQKDAQA
jgi:hypothetical protein